MKFFQLKITNFVIRGSVQTTYTTEGECAVVALMSIVKVSTKGVKNTPNFVYRVIHGKVYILELRF